MCHLCFLVFFPKSEFCQLKKTKSLKVSYQSKAYILVFLFFLLDKTHSLDSFLKEGFWRVQNLIWSLNCRPREYLDTRALLSWFSQLPILGTLTYWNWQLSFFPPACGRTQQHLLCWSNPGAPPSSQLWRIKAPSNQYFRGKIVPNPSFT